MTYNVFSGTLNRTQSLSLGISVVQDTNIWFLGPTRVHIPNGVSIGSAVFAQLTAERPYTLQWATPFPPPLKIAHSHGHLGPI